MKCEPSICPVSERCYQAELPPFKRERSAGRAELAPPPARPYGPAVGRKESPGCHLVNWNDVRKSRTSREAGSRPFPPMIT